MDDNRGEFLSETARRTFELIGLVRDGVAHTDGGILELTDDEGSCLTIPISRAATLKKSADNSSDGYYGYSGGYNDIGEWDEIDPQGLDPAAEEGGSDA